MDGEERSLAVADIRSMRVQTGRRGNWGMGAGIGAGVGFLAGLASAGATDCSDEFLQDLCQASQMAAPVMAGALGAGVGALIGGLIRSDRWEPVSFRTDVVALRGRRAAVGLAIRF
jgi:hypothetical protein